MEKKILPDGWKMITLKQAANYVNGRAFKPAEWENSGMPIIRIQNLNNPGAKYNFSTKKHDEKFLVKSGDLLFAWAASLGAFIWTGKNAWLNQHIFRVEPNAIIDKLYLYYALKNVISDISSKTHGSGMVHITKEPFLSMQIPLPSLPEQYRIVAKIEGLFSELDKGVAELQKVKMQLKIYRQAVLKEAFEGRLTKDWRLSHAPDVIECLKHIKKQSVAFKDISGDENELKLSIPTSWEMVRLGEIFDIEVGSTPSRRKPDYWNGSINWVSSGEVKFCRINRTNETITELGLACSSTNLQPTGTILLAMIGEGKTRGQAAILEIPAAHNQNTAAILVSNTLCSSLYLYYFLLLNYENIRRVGSGNNQKALNKERVKAIHFPFASYVEQTEIVQQIESRFSVCDKIEQTVDESLKKAEQLRQSILKQAFEGKLV